MSATGAAVLLAIPVAIFLILRWRGGRPEREQDPGGLARQPMELLIPDNPPTFLEDLKRRESALEALAATPDKDGPAPAEAASVRSVVDGFVREGIERVERLDRRSGSE